MSRDGVAWTARGLAAGVALSWMLLAGGCWPRDRFEAEGVERLCEAASACAGTYDAAACAAALTAPLEGCAYDRASAADCVAQLDHAACGEIEPFGDPSLEIPPTCETTFDCGDLDWLAPVRIE